MGRLGYMGAWLGQGWIPRHESRKGTLSGHSIVVLHETRSATNACGPLLQ
jgi:hypothetical protein